MLSRTKLWNLINDLIVDDDFKVFDIEMPNVHNDVVQVLIISTTKGKSISINDCALLNKRIRKNEVLMEMLSNYALEVSSAGINRKLVSDEHFLDAVNERVKLVFNSGKNAGQTIIGTLISFNNGSGLVKDDQGKLAEFNLTEIKSAKVDFIF